MGWYATRWVEAADEDEAKLRALEALRAAPQFADVALGCGASVTWEEIEVVDESEMPSIEHGFAFFEMEDQSATKAKASAKT